MRERHHLGDPGVDGRKMLRLISGSDMWGYGLNQAGSEEGQVVGTCE